jgi:hypothetical protein
MKLKSGVLTIVAGLLMLAFPVSNLMAAGNQRGAGKKTRRDSAAKPGRNVLPAVAQQKTGKTKDTAAAIKSEEVKFSGANLQLAGTLTLPKIEAGRRVPAVIIFSDAKPATRDGVAAGSGVHYLYRDLAGHLATKGIAVLRYDRRCVGASECKQPSAFDDFILDGEAVVKYMRSRADIDPQRIALFGHGEGGLLAAVVASHDEGHKDKLAGVALAATAGRFGHRVIRDQLRLYLADQGKTKDEIVAYVKQSDQLFQKINQGESNFSAFTFDPKNEADALLIRLAQDPPFAFGLLTTDPLQTVKTIRAPVLILQGDKDLFVGVADAEYLDEALARESHQDYMMKVIKDADYVFKASKGEASLKTYRDVSRPLDSTFVSVLSEWLQKRLKITGE